MKIVIVGAGVAGLAIGWRLAQAGATVEILERGIAGRGATWSSAGMIAPGAELKSETHAIARFARSARAEWPGFAADLERASGLPIYYRETGSLLVAENEKTAARLKAQAETLAGEDEPAEWLGPEDLVRREPLLSPALLGALHNRGDAQVDNRALTEALVAAVKKRGVTVREHCEVRSLLVEANEVRALVTGEMAIAADRIVLACGAWMNLIGGLGEALLPPVKPVKGQMAAYEPLHGTPLPQTLIWSDDVYLVPRHGRLMIGATVEEAGFDLSLSRAAHETLFASAARVIPALAQWRLAEMWSGLRPRTPDDAPVLGATTMANLFIAGGQFRNGILFAPAVADRVSRLVLDEPRGEDIKAFDPRRFSNS